MNSNNPVIVGLPDLATWYNSAKENQVNITVYQGYGKTNKKTMQTLTTVYGNDKVDALTKLNNFLSIYQSSGGQFHIFANHLTNGGQGYETDLYLPPTQQIAGIHGNSPQYTTPNQQHGIYGANVAEVMKEKADIAVRLAMLERDLQDERNAKIQDPPAAMIGKLGTLMFEDPDGFQKVFMSMCQGGAMLMDRASMMIKGTQPQLGTVGYTVPPEPQPIKDDNLPEENNQAPVNCIAAMSLEDKTAFVQAWEKVMQHFPNKTPKNVMDGLLMAMTLKPDLIKQIPVS